MIEKRWISVVDAVAETTSCKFRLEAGCSRSCGEDPAPIAVPNNQYSIKMCFKSNNAQGMFEYSI